MKPISFLCFLFILTQQSFAQNTSATSYDKLKASYDAAFKPADTASVLNRIANIRDCAGASSEYPNSLNRMMVPFKAVHKTESFGPDFPSTTYTGIGFESVEDNLSVVGGSFFESYKETFSKTALQLKTTHFYPKRECDSDGECWISTYSRPAQLELRLSEKYIH